MSYRKKKKGRKKMNKFIFLDIDGVLNGNDTHFIRLNKQQNTIGIGRKQLSCLNKIVEETDAKIVLISDWRLSFLPDDHLPKMASYITKKLAEIGLSLSLVSNVHRFEIRGEEIRKYIRENPCNGFVIIDDTDYKEYYEKDLYPHFLQTNYKKGLEEKDIKNAIEKLNIPLYNTCF